jgi:tetratricopeptide (TPR) repeat protein
LITSVTKAVKAEPGRHGARVNRGPAYTQMRRFEEAAEDFEAVLRVEERNAAALRGRGTLRFEKGEYEEAIEDLTQALVAEPGDEIAICMRGAAFVRLSRWREALMDFESVERAANPMIRQKVAAVIEEVRRKANSWEVGSRKSEVGSARFARAPRRPPRPRRHEDTKKTY